MACFRGCGMIIRDFNDTDVAPANAITNDVILSTPIHFACEPATDEAFRAYWQQGLCGGPWLAAEVDGIFAGYCKAGPWRDRAAYRFTVETGIYIAPAYQGRGIGRSLYLALFERLRAAGMHRVVAGITLPNEASVRLHEAVGFQYVGTFREVGWKFDRWHDVGWWEMGLR